MHRIALIVGINYYEYGRPLFGCINDAKAVEVMLARHERGEVNFDCTLLAGTGPTARVDRIEFKDYIKKLFTTEAETALLYFSGHGHIGTTGGYLLTTDAQRGDDGVSLSEILTLANSSPATNKIIILDSCHSGIAGNQPASSQQAVLSEGLTILSASTQEQYATEENGRGLFTSLLTDALNGSAANLTGDITPSSIYAHIDQSLGLWEQRPVFKTNVKRFVSLRQVSPPIITSDLHRIIELFPESNFEYQLDPTFEPEMKGRDAEMPLPNPKNTEKFALLQKYNRLNLLVPIDAMHMWNAAMESKKCKLTALGEHYWRLVKKNRI